MYPISSVSMYPMSTLVIGMRSRVISNSIGSPTPLLTMSTLTLVPFFPLSIETISEEASPTPAIIESSTAIILSPARMPVFSEGPFSMVFRT
ncbi:hypothetical protein ES705_42718 [subsurface metagenome]